MHPPAPPPRPVPLLLRLHLLFGGLSGTIGWCVAALGLLIGGVFALNADVEASLRLAGGAQHATGHVTGVSETAFSIGGDEYEEGDPVFAYDFEFDVEGHTYGGRSFQVGWTLDEGEAVPIEFVAEDPAVSRIVGMRARPFAGWLALLLLIPLGGLPLVLWGLRRGLRAGRLLAHGRTAEARLVDRRETNVTVNDLPLFAYTFEFEDDRGTLRRVEARSSMPWRLEDEPQETVLFDPFRPEQAVLVDSLPGHPDLDERGRFVEASPGRAVASLLAPAATLAVVLGLLALA